MLPYRIAHAKSKELRHCRRIVTNNSLYYMVFFYIHTYCLC